MKLLVPKEKKKSVVKEIRNFLNTRLLGTVNYLKFYYKFQLLHQSFFHLLKKNVNFEWTYELEKTRLELLTVLAKTNILSFPKDTNNNVIETDVSNIGIRGVMLQDDKIVAFYSRSLDNAEKNYSTTERECLAMIESLKYFSSYINGRKVKLITDHQPLKYVLTGKFNNRIIKWTMLLEEYDYEIIYRPGKGNHLADTLSKYPSNSNESINLELPIYSITGPYNNSNNNNNNTGNEPLQFTQECLAREIQKDPFNRAMVGMINDIKRFVEKCEICSTTKRKYGKNHGYLIPMDIPPFHTIGIDFIGPISTKDAKVYILVIIDYYRKWPEVFFTADQEADTVAIFLSYEVYTRYGAPSRLISDRGTSFLAKVLKDLNAIYGTEKGNSTAYHPQLDGQTENFNGTLITMLKAFIDNELYGIVFFSTQSYIKADDFVYVHTPYSKDASQVVKKFYRPWSGPSKVIEKLSDVTFKIDFGKNRKIHNVVNVNRLKKIPN
ncbi:hypothetical protein ACTFIW_003644 [Dictyostelium discoideum]